MTNRLQRNTSLIHRSVILDGLRALYIAQFKAEHILQEDPYATGYKEGFETALQSISEMMGISDEFESSRKRISKRDLDTMRLVSR